MAPYGTSWDLGNHRLKQRWRKLHLPPGALPLSCAIGGLPSLYLVPMAWLSCHSLLQATSATSFAVWLLPPPATGILQGHLFHARGQLNRLSSSQCQLLIERYNARGILPQGSPTIHAKIPSFFKQLYRCGGSSPMFLMLHRTLAPEK